MIKKIMDKERLIHFTVIILVIALYFHPYFNINTMPARADDPNIPGVHTNDLMSLLAIYPFEIRKVIDEYGQFPFWSPYRMGGTPIFAKPQAVFFYINLPLILFAPTIFAGVKWSILLHFVIAAASMYALMFYISKNNLASFVASFAYTFNGYIVSRLNWGQTNIIYPYAWIPFIFLFTFLALEKKNWVASSILVGVFFSLEVLGGGAQMFLYTSVLYFYFLLIYVVINFSKERFLGNIIKITGMSSVVLLVFFGLTAVFLMPNSDLMKIGVRSQGYSFEQSVGELWSINFSSIKDILINPHIFKKPHADWDSSGLGLVPSLLVLSSFFYARRKKVLLFLLLALIVILIFQGSFLYYIFWKYIPQFRQIKGIFKGFAILYFVLSILAGFGFMYLLDKTQKLKKNIRSIIVYSTILLLMVNLTIFNNKLTMMTDIKYELSKNQVLSFIAKDKDIFRFHIFETKGIDWGTDHYSVLSGLNDVYGTENIWLVDYLPIYLSYANQIPAKGYGILNTKYITSTQPLNISNYNFIKKFEECGYYPNGADICQPRKSDGPYLYQNEKFLPRAYTVRHSVLVAGNKDSLLQIVYFMMSNPDFNPSNAVIVHGEGGINNYGDSFLRSFDMIVLAAGSIDADSAPKLAKYVSNGGILVPNVVNGESTLEAGKLSSLLANISGSDSDYSKIEKAEISYYSPNKAVVETKSRKGFLVMSEQFSLYPGWHAQDETGRKKDIQRADGVISAVYLDGTEKKIIFEYTEKSFFRGVLISSATLLLIISYFVYYFWKKRRQKIQE